MSFNRMIRNSAWFTIAAVGLSSFAVAQSNVKAKESASSLLNSRPTSFTQNKGQWDSRAMFFGHGNGVDFWVTKEGFTFSYLPSAKDGKAKFGGHAVGMLFDGASKFSAVGIDASGTRQFIKANSSVKASNFRKVRLNGVYPGIDSVAYFDTKNPRYDFVVKPGANVEAIKLAFKGASEVTAKGDRLNIGTVFGTKTQEGLFAYQMNRGKKVPVRINFKQIDSNRIGFEVGAYDKSKELVIDPLVYGSYYGGDAGYDEVRGVAADNNGSVYLTGYTRSNQYPVLYGPFGFNLTSGKEAFVSRLQGDAYNHDYSAIITGSGDEQGNYISIDPSGNVWVAGNTTSANFPLNTSFTASSGAGNMWLMRFALSGATVLDPFAGSTVAGQPLVFRFGGAAAATSITSFNIQSNQSATPTSPVRFLMTGSCDTAGMAPLALTANRGAYFMTLDYTPSDGDIKCNVGDYVQATAGAISRVSATGSAIDGNGNLYVSGAIASLTNSDTAAGSPVFTTTSNVFTGGRLQRKGDIYVRKYSSTGTLIWSGLVGGSSDDSTQGVLLTGRVAGGQRSTEIAGSTLAVDLVGNVYVLGRTGSFDFPRTRGVFGEVFISGRSYLTLTKITSDGSTILYSTNLQDTGTVIGSGIGVDYLGNAYVTGTLSQGRGVNNPPPDPIEPGSTGGVGSIPLVNPIRSTYGTANTGYPDNPEAATQDGFLMIVNPDATSIVRSTQVGGILDDGVFAPYVDRGGDVWVFGWTDTWRYYTVTSSSGTVTERIPGGRSGGLDTGFITNFAFKQGPEPSGLGVRTESGYFYSTPFGDVGFNMRYTRDGFLLRFRETAPLISNLSLSPAQIAGGDPAGLGNAPFSTGTVTLSGPAPTGGATLQLSLSNGAAASFLSTTNTTTSTLVIPAGSTTGSFQVFGRQVIANTAVQVSVSYGGNLRIGTVTVVPWLQNVTVTGTTIIGGNSTSGTVRLNAPAPSGGVVVNLSTDRPDLITYPGGATVTVPTGASQANFNIDTNGVDTSQSTKVSTSLLGLTTSADLTVTPASMTRVVLTPSTVAAGSSATGVVQLNGKAGSPQTINLAIQGNPAGYTITPSTVVIPSGANQSPTFTISTPFELNDVGRIVTAVRVSGGSVIDGPVTGTLNVQSNAVAGLTLNPATIESGAKSTATVTLTSAPQTPAIVKLETGNAGVATPVDANGVPITEVVVPAGSTSVTFDVQAFFSLNGNTVVPIRAYRSPTKSDLKTANLTVNALTYTMTVAPSTLFGGTSATGTIKLSAKAIAGFSMSVTCNDPSISFTQPTFTVGSDTATFDITTVDIPVSKTVIFSTQVGTLPVASAALTILATEVTGVKVKPFNRIRQGSNMTIEITVNRNVPVASSGTLTFTNPSLVFPITGNTVGFVIPAGSNKTQVVLRGNKVPRDLLTTITAQLSTLPGASSASTTLWVIR